MISPSTNSGIRSSCSFQLILLFKPFGAHTRVYTFILSFVPTFILNAFKYCSGFGKSHTIKVISSCRPLFSRTLSTTPSTHSLASLCLEHILAISESFKAAKTPSEATKILAPLGGNFTLVHSGSLIIASLRAKFPTALETANPPGYSLSGPASLPSLLFDIRASLYPAETNLCASKGSSGVCSRANLWYLLLPSTNSSLSSGCGSIKHELSPTFAQTI